MNKNGKYERDDLVRICQAAFGPLIEVDHAVGKGYYVNLLRNEGPLKCVPVARIIDAPSADAMAKKVLGLAGVVHDSWTEEVDGKPTVKWEPLDDVLSRVRGQRDRLTAEIQAKLGKEART